jgi:erythromycin esterase-like protein
MARRLHGLAAWLAAAVAGLGLALAGWAALAQDDLGAAATPLTGDPSDYDRVVVAAAEARFVLLGESTHGTREYYVERARITERLVREQGFGAVIIEGDWPETERVNRYVRGLSSDRTAEEALSGFSRFPTWMWRNNEFRDLIERLRAHNLSQPVERRVGVYGMDVYNLSEASDAVVAWLSRNDPASADKARRHYRCFAPYRGDLQAYGAATRRPQRSCETAAAAVLADMRARPRPSDPIAAEAQFSALRHAASVVGAEAYYRAVYAGAYSWNVRDRAMTQTIEEIADHVGAASGGEGRVVVWAHNSHLGDARATEKARAGEINIGQLLRERHAGKAFSLGFLTDRGTVMAATEWDRPGRVRNVTPALEDSHAGVLRRLGVGPSLVMLKGQQLPASLAKARLQRMIGVIYRPDMEREAHYFQVDLQRQFDAVAFVPETRAVTPLR